MCEFKVIKKNNNSLVTEDIVVLSYDDDNRLILKDILGSGTILDSAMIIDVNTLNQTCTIIEHSLIKDFITLIKKSLTGELNDAEITEFQAKIDNLKQS
ncbi:MAG: CooT family nickel-binding protein [Promethearchaeota archaeon]